MTSWKLIITITLVSSISTTFHPLTNLAQIPTPADKKSLNPIKLGIVRNSDSFDGAGCSLQLPADYEKHNERHVFLSDYENNAVVNIDDLDTTLKLVHHREPKGDPKKDDRSTWIYGAKGTEVRVDFLVTGVCDPNDESCEVTYYDATITVTRGNSKTVMQAKGVCGS